MTLNEFQDACLSTNKYNKEEMLTCCTLGVASEAGEVAGKLDKWIRKNHNSVPSQDFSREIALEVFDVLWFASGVAKALGYEFDDIAQLGIQKLADRDKRNMIADLKGGDHR